MYLLEDGLRQSPLKTISGFSFLMLSTPVLKRAAPPTGSLLRSSTSYTSLKCTILRWSAIPDFNDEDDEIRSARWLVPKSTLEADDSDAGGATLNRLSRIGTLLLSLALLAEQPITTPSSSRS